METTEVDKTGKISCGVFIPLPHTLAKHFPDKSDEDDSVPHVTVLYIGDVTADEQTKVVEAVRECVKDWPPFTMNVCAYSEFKNDKGQTIPHMEPTADIRVKGPAGVYYRSVGELHADLFAAVESCGVEVCHMYGHTKVKPSFSDRARTFKLHATLAYVNAGEPAYSGPKPTGNFMVTEVEVWGWEKYRIPLGKTTADLPSGAGMTLAPPFGTSMLEGLTPPADEQSKHALYQAITQRCAQLAGVQQLHLVFPHFGPKGMDTAFKEGGSFKLRPREDGAVVAKLKGLPSPHSRWIGAGGSAEAAIADLKDEDDHLLQYSPKHQQAAVAAPAAPKPAGAPTAKPVSAATPASPAVTTPASIGVAAAPPKPKAEKKPKGQDQSVVGGQALHNDVGVDQETFDRYANALKLATDLIRRKGFGFILGRTTMHLRNGQPGVLGNYTGAEFSTTNPEVEIFVNNIGDKANHEDIALTMVHELGHHYYYKEIPRALRKTYGWYFQKAAEHPSAYGATKRYEDFAEIFAAFVGRGTKIGSSKQQYQLTPDIMQRFRTFLSQDKRINLKAEWFDMEGKIVKESRFLSLALGEAVGAGNPVESGSKPASPAGDKPDKKVGPEDEKAKKLKDALDRHLDPSRNHQPGVPRDEQEPEEPEFDPHFEHGHSIVVGSKHGAMPNLAPETIEKIKKHAKHGVHHEGPELDGNDGVSQFVHAHLGGDSQSWEAPEPQPGDPRWHPHLAHALFGGSTQELHDAVVNHDDFDPKASLHDNLLATADAWFHPEHGAHVSSHDLNHLVKSVADDPAASQVHAESKTLHKLLHGGVEGLKKFHKIGNDAMFPQDHGRHEHHTKISRIADTAHAARDAHLAHQMRTKGGVYFAGKDNVHAAAARLSRSGEKEESVGGPARTGASLFDRMLDSVVEGAGKTEQSDMPGNKYQSVSVGSSRTGIGTAPPPDTGAIPLQTMKVGQKSGASGARMRARMRGNGGSD